ncbi:MAG TPA: VWA domain-containing protein [Firmicutes bacterium]|nr:VWA domain-containing protein [Bacillota bacterium]
MEKIKNNQEIDVVFLLDRSGSMSNCTEDTIGGYNSYLEKERKNKFKTNITTILFDDKYDVLYSREDVKNVNNLTNKEYYARGCTALLDAIGKTINDISTKVKDNKVLFIITTDGLENASKEYDKKKIKSLIKKHKDWEFIYLGANIDSYAEGSSIGIKTSNISNYTKSKKGIGMMFDCLEETTCMYMKSNTIDESWKNKLDNKKEN